MLWPAEFLEVVTPHDAHQHCQQPLSEVTRGHPSASWLLVSVRAVRRTLDVGTVQLDLCALFYWSPITSLNSFISSAPALVLTAAVAEAQGT